MISHLGSMAQINSQSSDISTPRRQFLEDFLKNIQKLDDLILMDEEINSTTENRKDKEEPIVKQLKILLYHMEMLKNRAAKINQNYSKLKNEYHLKIKENEHLKAELDEQKTEKQILENENSRLKAQLESLMKCQPLDAASLLHSTGYAKEG